MSGRDKDNAPAEAGAVPMLWRITKGGKPVIGDEMVRRAVQDGDSRAALELFGLLGHTLREGKLSTEHQELLCHALHMLHQGVAPHRAFMKSPFSRSKPGVKSGAVRSGKPGVRRKALQMLREMNPKSDHDVAEGIRKIAVKAGVKSHATIEADIRKQLDAEAGRPVWPLAQGPFLTYDDFRSKYPELSHEEWAAMARWENQRREDWLAALDHQDGPGEN